MKHKNSIRHAALTCALTMGLLPLATPAQAVSADGNLPESCATETPKIGVALPNTVNPYYVAMQNSFQEHGQKLGFDVNVAIANDNDSQQLSQIQAFIQQGVCAVALNAVNSGPGASSVRALNQAGIPVFTVNITVSPADLEAQQATFVQYVGVDQRVGGVQMGEQVLRDFGEDANIVAGIIGNPNQIPTNQRDAGFKDTIKQEYPNAEFLQTLNGKIDPSVSLQVAGDLLQGNPDINVIFADAGPHAIGAIQAVQQQGRGDEISIYAFCAPEKKLEGHYKACVAQEPAEYAKIVLDSIETYINGGDVEAEILKPLKVFTTGETPAPGEVG